MSDEAGFVPFPSTHWSLVAQAGGERSDVQREALGTLLHRYEPAFRTFLAVRYGLRGDRADDVVQGFILGRVMERDLFARADRGRGKFRNFVMTALERYALDQFRRDAAQKRAGDRSAVDAQAYGDEMPAAGADPAAAFDAAWAAESVREAIDRMRRATEPHRPDLWGVFADRLLGPSFDGSEPTAYAGLVDRLGFADEGQASSALKTAKRIFARTLRGVVTEYEMTADEVDAEVNDLRTALAAGR